MKRFLLPALFCSLAVPAAAERADAYQPTSIKCGACDANSLTGSYSVAGGVEVTRGTLRIDADSGQVEESADGFQRLVLRAAPGSKVRFRQKADGPGERWMDGEADRVEYDDRSALVTLLAQAKVRRTVGGLPTETAEGECIVYDSRREQFTVRNTISCEDRPGAGRGTIVLQSKRRPPPAPAIVTKEQA